ncbi:MAG: hypothetical protein J4F35_11720 [Candidatus Latescibacteria bacterium]|nr:hypothetical protein [Candidatus Latescibacterota bacterium]
MVEYEKAYRLQSLPEFTRPNWLADNMLDGNIPIIGLLRNSIFYPASGLDSDPIMHLGHHFWSFVYADYGYEPEFIKATLSAERFAGYKLLGRRSVSENELPLARWNSESDGWLEGGNNREARERGTPPFAQWALLVRDYGQEKPRELMSLLFVGAEGVTLFKKLYVDNEVAPACLAIIQPSDEMGENWTNFNDPNAYLAKTVMTNPSGSPRFLLYGGNGQVEWCKSSPWPEYDKLLAWPLERRINQDRKDDPLYSWKGNREGALSLWKRRQ